MSWGQQQTEQLLRRPQLLCDKLEHARKQLCVRSYQLQLLSTLLQLRVPLRHDRRQAPPALLLVNHLALQQRVDLEPLLTVRDYHNPQARGQQFLQALAQLELRQLLFSHLAPPLRVRVDQLLLENLLYVSLLKHQLADKLLRASVRRELWRDHEAILLHLLVLHQIADDLVHDLLHLQHQDILVRLVVNLNTP